MDEERSVLRNMMMMMMMMTKMMMMMERRDTGHLSSPPHPLPPEP